MPLEDFLFNEPGTDVTKPLFLPGAEALVPVNPGRWPAHAVATAFTSDVGLIENPQLQMLDNVETTLAYLSTGSSLHETIDRTQKVIFDVGVISTLHEICPTAGAIVAGDYANQCADYYNEEACRSRANPSLENDLSYIIRNQKSILQENIEGEEVTDSFQLKLRGPGKSANIPQADRQSVFKYAGLAAENLPLDQRKLFWQSLFTQPRKADRPLWTYKPFQTRGGSCAIVASYSRYPLLYLVRKYKSKTLYYVYKVMNRGVTFYFTISTILFFTNILRRQYYLAVDNKFVFHKIKTNYKKKKLKSRIRALRKPNKLFGAFQH